MKRKIEEMLMGWKNDPHRKPLILNGARQVGKTYSIMAFGKKNYENVVYINLEINKAVAGFFEDDIEPMRIIQFLEAYSGEAIRPGGTLIVLDEIQACERALTALKYFCEDAPAYHVASAGSLLGVAVHREQFSYPVGKVQTLTMVPMDFEEFLMADGQEALAEMIRESFARVAPLPEALHRRALDAFRRYLIVGGMPAAVAAYADGKSLLPVPTIQSGIMDDYLADMAKYASPAESVKIRACYESIPAQLAKENHKFQYKVVKRGGTAAIFGVSIDWLQYAGVIYKCQKTEQGMDPIAVYTDLSSFKLYMADTGMLTMKSGMAQTTILSGDRNQFLGALTENYIAQALAANGYGLYYWTSGNSAELDFLIEKNGVVTAIEVKSTDNTKSKSLNLFLQRFHPDRAFKISTKNFGAGENYTAIPLYAAFCL